MGRILAIGMSNTDLVCRAPRLPQPGETVAGRSFDTFAGGKGANQAVAAARAGAEVVFAGAVGDDAYGVDRLRNLEEAGVDVTSVQVIPGTPSGIAVIIVDDRGENQIVTAAGANERFDPLLLLQTIDGQPFDLALVTWELDPETSMSIVAGLASSTPLVVNLAPFDETIRDILPDERLIMICNRVEAGQLLGRSLFDEDMQCVAREIQALGCRAAIITLGSSGAAGADPHQAWFVRAPEVNVVDTTGAGDAFCGAFAAWLADGATFEEATRAGVAAGARSVSSAGAQASLPDRAQILSLLNRAGGENNESVPGLGPA